jgi:hypothetical protein
VIISSSIGTLARDGAVGVKAQCAVMGGDHGNNVSSIEGNRLGDCDRGRAEDVVGGLHACRCKKVGAGGEES